MEEKKQTTETFAEEIFRQIRNTIPNVSLGFPSADEIQCRRNGLLESEHNRWIRRQYAEDREFQRLKDAALAQLKKDRQ